MSSADRANENAPASSDVATRLGDAGFVRLVPAQTGDAVAAAGLLARTLEAAGVAFQTSVEPVPSRADCETDADVTVALGRPATCATVTLGLDRPASEAAFAVRREFDRTAGQPLDRETVVLALAGTLAAGTDPDETLLGPADDVGLDRRPGVAIPTRDVADALAHSTLVHAPFSGSVERTTAVLADAGITVDRAETSREVASLVALSVAGDEQGTERGAHSVERLLRPHVGGPFETIGGFADVLSATARERPGLAVALAMGVDEREQALAVWREHASRAHAAVREARTGRYNGLYVARFDTAVPTDTVARLLRDYRSPEPVVVTIADGEAVALAHTGNSDSVPAVGDGERGSGDGKRHVGTAMREAAHELGGAGGGTATRGRARFDGDSSEFVLALREAL